MTEKRKKLLLVDDDAHTLRVTKGFLESHGYTIVTSHLPFIAPLFKEEEPDLVVMDLEMPLLPGDRLVEVLKSRGLTTKFPVIFYSGKSIEALIKVVRETGAAGFVSKDQGLDALLEKVRQVIGPAGGPPLPG